MVVKKKTNEVLDIAIARGNKPVRHVATGRVTIATNQSAKQRSTYKVLQHEDGTVTAAGRYYYDKTGEQPQSDRHFDRNQEPVRRGNSDYIKTRSGWQVVRRFGADGKMHLTSLGRRYFKDKHEEFIVEIPVKIEVTNSRGERRIRGAQSGEQLYMPTTDVETINIGRVFASKSMSLAQQVAYIKSQILLKLGGRTRAGRTLLKEGSGQKWYYDGKDEHNNDREWLISAL
jgi:hypothetical protein